ncbi:hypothetical protein HanXRQr2_Chr12g0540111 [Helianthus annuus]|uniref:Uncharacterized protein n=1 Tax=Helianthus annuus TaxID=4232 RepID=A0A9K3MVY2_HELAN|nr:hypothetical protein HanXRQr2_Chr12g0540111 [Helianthus annuus]
MRASPWSLSILFLRFRFLLLRFQLLLLQPLLLHFLQHTSITINNSIIPKVHQSSSNST